MTDDDIHAEYMRLSDLSQNLHARYQRHNQLIGLYFRRGLVEKATELFGEATLAEAEWQAASRTAHAYYAEHYTSEDAS